MPLTESDSIKLIRVEDFSILYVQLIILIISKKEEVRGGSKLYRSQYTKERLHIWKRSPVFQPILNLGKRGEEANRLTGQVNSTSQRVSIRCWEVLNH